MIAWMRYGQLHSLIDTPVIDVAGQISDVPPVLTVLGFSSLALIDQNVKMNGCDQTDRLSRTTSLVVNARNLPVITGLLFQGVGLRKE